MNRRQRRSLVSSPIVRALAVVALVVTAAGLGGCGHKIGDSCTTSADCDPTSGTRTCDLSEPGGYCILEGCDARSCPSDSVCARFFPEPPLFEGMSAKTCDPSAGAAATTVCQADEVCVVNPAPDPTLDLSDPANTGVCVRASLEKRACVESCGSDGDCRGGYFCRPLQGTGSCGTLALTLDPAATPKYCAPQIKDYAANDGGDDAGVVSNACSLRTLP